MQTGYATSRSTRRHGRGSGGIVRTVLALALVLALASCGWGQPPDTGSSPGGSDPGGSGTGGSGSTSLSISLPQQPPNWDFWQTSATAAKVPVMYNVVEPLLQGNSDGSVSPLLAEEYEVSDDGLTYTFVIREAKFHDGSDLTSADVVYSLKRGQESGLPKMSQPFQPVTSIEAPDERTVVVTLSRPSQSFLAQMTKAQGAVIPEDSAEQMAQQPIGTGPYVFGTWRPDVELPLTRFDDYWGEQPYFTDVLFRFIGEESAAISALESGELDGISTVLGDGVERLDDLSQNEKFGFTLAASPAISYISLNASLDMWDDERVRQAVAHALNRDAILEAAVAGYGETTCVMVNPPNEPWQTDYCPYDYDPDKARALLAEAGAEDLTVEFQHLTIAEFPAIMQVVVAQMADVGITLEPEGMELATFLDRVNAEPFAYQMTSLTGDKTIDAWVCPGDMTQLCDEDFDQKLADADASTDMDEYVRLRREAIEWHADQAYLIPVFTKSNPSVYTANLTGVKDFRVDAEFDLRDLQWAE